MISLRRCGSIFRLRSELLGVDSALCSGEPFSFNSSIARTAQTLNAIIGGVHVPTLSDVVFEDQRIPPPVQIPWYYTDF